MAVIPPVPPVADADRIFTIEPTGPVLQIEVPFPIYGDARDIYIKVPSGEISAEKWTLISKSGSPISTLPQPITDGVIQFNEPIGGVSKISVIGRIRPRQLIMPTASGIARREFNQENGFIVSALREFYSRFDNIPSGPPGPAGREGAVGPQGNQGPEGLQGRPGIQGPMGIAGERGAQGVMGPQGPMGNEGPEGPSLPGPQGEAGPKGEQGPRGVQGTAGDTGPEGPDGPPGPQGEQGARGPEGDQGPQGIPGPEGDPGIQGPMGPQGKQGAPGQISDLVGSFKNHTPDELPVDGLIPQDWEGPGDPPAPYQMKLDESLIYIGTVADGRVGGLLSQHVFIFKGAQGWIDAGQIQGPEGPIGPQGVAGPRGPQGQPGQRGDDGSVGPEGPQGPQGIRGPAGPAGRTGDEGPEGPRGFDGAQGPQGQQGPEGPKGDQGRQGVDGQQGPKGDDGRDGPQGLQGIQGNIGPQGPRGNEGPRGVQGNQGDPGIPCKVAGEFFNRTPAELPVSGLIPKDWDGPNEPPRNIQLAANDGLIYNGTRVPGKTGHLYVWIGNFGEETDGWVDAGRIVGPEGPRGATGSQGEQGPQGDNGPEGPQGPAGQDGPEGPRGPEGPQGNDGEQGIQGPQGEQGIQGIQGEQGPRGEQGDQGPEGPQGIQGQDGPEGPIGPEGPAGKFSNLRGEFVNRLPSELPSDGFIPKDFDGPGEPPIDVQLEPKDALIYNGTAATQYIGHLFIFTGEPGIEIDGWINGGVIVGPQGPRGPEGPEGPQGPVGVKGDQGDQGPEGIQGQEGPDGPRGPEGPQGRQGEKGDEGPQGPQGPAGNDGPQGPRGPQGDEGPQGPQGPQGPVDPYALDKRNNLSDLQNAGIAIQYLGALDKNKNLQDLTNAATARANLSLGDAAIRNVGTTVGTVAAGNDPRFNSSGYDGKVETKSVNGGYTLIASDTGKLLRVESAGTITVPSSLGLGFHCWIYNAASGGGNITVSTNAVFEIGSSGNAYVASFALKTIGIVELFIQDAGGKFTVSPLHPSCLLPAAAPGASLWLDSAAKIPAYADKVIISGADPDPGQGDQNWIWFKV